MIGRSNPFFDKYFRYTISWLLFGVFGSYYLWQWGWFYGVISLLLALFLSFGIDYILHFTVKGKVRAMVNEEPLVVVDAMRIKLEKRGYLVATDQFVLFVPVFKKIKTVIEWEQIVRYVEDGYQIDITARFPNRYRTFSYCVISKKKFLQHLEEKTGKNVPYKYDKITNNSLS